MNLTDEEIRIKVAEAMGWTVVEDDYGVCGTIDGIHWHSPAGFPNYPQDLNACAEFGKTLNNITDAQKFARHLMFEVCGYITSEDVLNLNGWVLYRIACATARQRCLAYLKTKGLIP